MPWKEVSTMSLRREFVELAQPAGALCRRFRISPTTGYRWLRRYHSPRSRGLAALLPPATPLAPAGHHRH